MAITLSQSGAGDEPEVLTEINTTPLIDVMLVLLVMLIITIPVQLHAVNLNLPLPLVTPPTTPPPAVTIDVDADATVRWNGEVVANRRALEDHLREVVAQADQPEVHLHPNKDVEYKAVAAVLASAQRLGVKKLGVLGNEQFEDQ